MEAHLCRMMMDSGLVNVIEKDGGSEPRGGDDEGGGSAHVSIMMALKFCHHHQSINPSIHRIDRSHVDVQSDLVAS